jgi:hypothetical protein
VNEKSQVIHIEGRKRGSASGSMKEVAGQQRGTEKQRKVANSSKSNPDSTRRMGS